MFSPTRKQPVLLWTGTSGGPGRGQKNGGACCPPGLTREVEEGTEGSLGTLRKGNPQGSTDTELQSEFKIPFVLYCPEETRPQS